MMREMPADLDTPVTAFLKLRPAGARFILESVEQGERLGRYSFVGVGAQREIVVENDTARVVADGREHARAVADDPLSLIREMLGPARKGPGHRSDDPARSAGATVLRGATVGFVSFDYVARLEKLTLPPDPEFRFPEMAFVVPRAVVTFDHLRRVLTIDGPEGLAEELLDRLRGPLPGDAAIGPADPPAFRASVDEASFAASVLAAKERILEGDIFQVVLSHHLDATTTLEPFALYRALRMRNPSPYSYFLDFPPWQIVGTSPELLCRLSGRRALVRPIAGTRRRCEDPDEDTALEQELRADDKEISEHVMLVDLGRNDLSRVCLPGTVSVDAFKVIERFSHVMHLVSWVSGEMAPGRDALDLLRACFPAGTVSGAPKRKAIEILLGLERERRGPYAGAVGYFSPEGDADFAIAIRTAFFSSGRLRLQAGAGIVAGSDPAREYAETLEKMAALREAVAFAAGGFR